MSPSRPTQRASSTRRTSTEPFKCPMNLCGSRRGNDMAVDLTDLRRYRDDPRHRIVLSVDLGKFQDFTAFTISEIKPESYTNVKGNTVSAMFVHVRDIQRLDRKST